METKELFQPEDNSFQDWSLLFRLIESLHASLLVFDIFKNNEATVDSLLVELFVGVLFDHISFFVDIVDSSTFQLRIELLKFFDCLVLVLC